MIKRLRALWKFSEYLAAAKEDDAVAKRMENFQRAIGALNPHRAATIVELTSLEDFPDEQMI